MTRNADTLSGPWRHYLVALRQEDPDAIRAALDAFRAVRDFMKEPARPARNR
jgi:hypothetical protein